MQAGTGRALSGLAHLQQSINDILTTPLGSRLMLHDYGSILPDLIDQPMNPGTRQKLFGAVATALQRWEPRIRLKRVGLQQGGGPSQWTLSLDAERLDVPARSALRAVSLNLDLGRAQLAGQSS